MATKEVVRDVNNTAKAAMQRRLDNAKAKILQQEHKNLKYSKTISDVNFSSKQLHQANSLPILSKRSISTDPKENDFLAYATLSHSVDENVQISTVCKVLHNLLQGGDSAQKYLKCTKTMNMKKDSFILLDNFEQSRSLASKNTSQKNSKRSKSRMSMKRLKKSGALNLPGNLHKFDLFKPMHGKWESYMMQLIKVIGKDQLAITLLSADLHGAYMLVVECNIASFTGVQGIMVCETSNTFGIITRDDKLRASAAALITLFYWNFYLAIAPKVLFLQESARWFGLEITRTLEKPGWFGPGRFEALDTIHSNLVDALAVILVGMKLSPRICMTL